MSALQNLQITDDLFPQFGNLKLEVWQLILLVFIGIFKRAGEEIAFKSVGIHGFVLKQILGNSVSLSISRLRISSQRLYALSIIFFISLSI